MKDEIKEILDKLQKVANRETASRNALMEMKDKDYQLLLDYITNLQEENERVSNLYETYEEANELWIKKCENYKSRIDKAVEYIKLIENNTPNSTRKNIAKMILINYKTLLNLLNGDDE